MAGLGRLADGSRAAPRRLVAGLRPNLMLPAESIAAGGWPAGWAIEDMTELRIMVLAQPG